MTKRPAGAQQPTAPSSAFISIASLLIVIHFVCVFLAFSGNVLRSELQDQLLRRLFRPYLQSLNFDPDSTPYHFTRSTVDDVDHRWEVLPVGGDASQLRDWVAIPPSRSAWSESTKRWQRTAKLVAYQASQENEDAAAEVARGVARYAHQRLKITPQQIRCRRLHNMQEWGDGVTEPSEIPYIANVIIDSNGRVNVAKASQRSETALPETNSGEAAP